MPEFYPPQLTPIYVRLCQSVAPLIGHWRYRMNLEIQPDSLEKLAALQDYRLLLLPNHPTFHDWIAIFLLSARLGETFHYLAAYERFKGLGGQFLQRMGAYSIRRGLGDRPSVAQTLDLLMQPHCRLVIFPEGGCSFQNDTVMPFRPGAVQVAFQAMNKLVRQGKPVPDLYVVPIILKYRYAGDMTPVIHQTLTRLEKALQISSASTFYERLDHLAERVLLTFEQDYGLNPNQTRLLSRNERIAYIKTHVLQNCEQQLGMISSPTDPLRERVYKLQHVLEARAETFVDDQFWTYNAIHKAAARLLNFDAIYDGYVAASPTPERFLDTLIRLERAVFSIAQPVPKGDRKVVIRVGEAVNLKDYFEQYQQERSLTVDILIRQIQQTVQQNLDIINIETK